MLRHYYINKEWMLSATAQRVYRTAAGFSLGLFFFLLALPVVRELPVVFLPLMKLALLACVLGTAITLVAMEYFFFGFDRSPSMKKVLWFCVMLLPPLGPALYCFLVYSPAARKRCLETPGQPTAQPRVP